MDFSFGMVFNVFKKISTLAHFKHHFMRALTFSFLFLSTGFLTLFAQVKETLPPDYIRTIQFTGNTEFSGTPIVELGQPLKLEFDDLVGDEADYYYKIEHHNFDWKPSNLAKNEVITGYDNVRIFNYENSFNTLQIFSHYNLKIPNQYVKGLKVSGNYMIKILNSDDELVFSRKFIVYEDIVSVQVQTKRSRNVEFINTKQVVNFSVDGGKDFLITNPAQNLKTLIVKNNNLQNSIYNLKPQYNIGNKYIYKYDQKAAFWGGNEYLFFDNKDIRSSTINIQRIALDEIYHTYLYPDENRFDNIYTYNPDINGNFVVRKLRSNQPNIEAEYNWVHFALPNQRDFEGQVYIYGNFNNYTLDKSTRMKLNTESGYFEGKRLFKQGFYNYKYVLKKPDGSVNTIFFSNSFDETENQYVVLAYYRGVGGRYDRVIGVGSANSRNITN
jgi:hypothetical protein